MEENSSVPCAEVSASASDGGRFILLGGTLRKMMESGLCRRTVKIMLPSSIISFFRDQRQGWISHVLIVRLLFLQTIFCAL